MFEDENTVFTEQFRLYMYDDSDSIRHVFKVPICYFEDIADFGVAFMGQSDYEVEDLIARKQGKFLTTDSLLSSRDRRLESANLYNQFSYFKPQRYSKIKSNAKLKIMWMHDTFAKGDHLLEDMWVESSESYSIRIEPVLSLPKQATFYIKNMKVKNHRYQTSSALDNCVSVVLT